MSTYTTTVGIEVHAQLKTKSKMFCGCKNDPHASTANANTCPVCMAHPGTLPTVNKEAVTALFKMGHAIGGALAEFSEFDRKNYFYPDIPKAYQISQYKHPFVVGGEIAGVAITRVHLEEDTARSVHDQDQGSLVDFNRAGVPLMELVTEPVIHSPKQAADFAKELQLLLRTIGISDANMEKGEMRVEANISISDNPQLGTKVEVKNLNSFKSVEMAITYEAKRHQDVLASGGTIIQETRGWDEGKQQTYTQRVKETAEEYRYFPDPDITKYIRSEIPDFSDSRIAEITPLTVAQNRDFLYKHRLSENQVELIVADLSLFKMFNELLSELSEQATPSLAANYTLNDLSAHVLSGDHAYADVSVKNFAKLLDLVSKEQITSRVAKDILKDVVFLDKDPLDLAKEKGLLQMNSADAISSVIEQVIAEHPSVVLEYKSGKVASIQFLVGQGMKLSKGSANPEMLRKLLEESLS